MANIRHKKGIKKIIPLIQTIKNETKVKNLLELAIHITNYYFHFNIDKEYIDKELLERMALLFMLDILGYLTHPYRKKKIIKETLADIDKELCEWKKATFNEWLINTVPVTEKQIREKRRKLRLQND